MNADPELFLSYASVFDNEEPDSHAVMSDLGNQFGNYGKSTYDPSEVNAASNSVYRAGQQSVLQYILYMMNGGTKP